MPLLFLPANRSDGGGGVMVSPLTNFTDAAHATHADMWRHGPNGRPNLASNPHPDPGPNQVG